MKIKKRYLLLTPALVLVGMLPANASWNPLTPLINQALALKSSFVSFYENLDSNLIKLLGLEEYTEFNISFGEMGLPDMKDLEKELKKLILDEGNYNLKEIITNEQERNITREKAFGTLSKDGQEQQSQKIDELSSSATSSFLSGQQAQIRVVTQEVLKDIALQNAQLNSTMSLIGTEIMDLSQKQDLANINLSNISEGIDRQNLAEINQNEGASYSVMQLTGLISAGYHKSK
jgi:hypothetical protein